MRVDLHTHSTASDGRLTPVELCERALAVGVDLLALTDHDTCAGFLSVTDADDGAERKGPRPFRGTAMRLIAGVEYSCQWHGVGLHVLGLGIDPGHAASRAALAMLGQARQERAAIIGERLAKLGIAGAAAGAAAIAGAGQVGRPHFAQFLVDRGVVRTMNEAFDRYLGAGKRGDVKTGWPELPQVVDWVCRAGGVAVLAHPLKYRLTATRLKRVVGEFRDMGGEGLEVVSGRQTGEATAQLGRLCRQFELAASTGSDFHQPGAFSANVGEAGLLPPDCRPVWERWLS